MYTGGVCTLLECVHWYSVYIGVVCTLVECCSVYTHQSCMSTHTHTHIQHTHQFHSMLRYIKNTQGDVYTLHQCTNSTSVHTSHTPPVYTLHTLHQCTHSTHSTSVHTPHTPPVYTLHQCTCTLHHHTSHTPPPVTVHVHTPPVYTLHLHLFTHSTSVHTPPVYTLHQCTHSTSVHTHAHTHQFHSMLRFIKNTQGDKIRPIDFHFRAKKRARHIMQLLTAAHACTICFTICCIHFSVSQSVCSRHQPVLPFDHSEHSKRRASSPFLSSSI